MQERGFQYHTYQWLYPSSPVSSQVLPVPGSPKLSTDLVPLSSQAPVPRKEPAPSSSWYRAAFPCWIQWLALSRWLLQGWQGVVLFVSSSCSSLLAWQGGKMYFLIIDKAAAAPLGLETEVQQIWAGGSAPCCRSVLCKSCAQASQHMHCKYLVVCAVTVKSINGFISAHETLSHRGKN